jgi:hypothetical protein
VAVRHAASPDAFAPALAASLPNLADRLEENGRRDSIEAIASRIEIRLLSP